MRLLMWQVYGFQRIIDKNRSAVFFTAERSVCRKTYIILKMGFGVRDREFALSYKNILFLQANRSAVFFTAERFYVSGFNDAYKNR